MEPDDTQAAATVPPSAGTAPTAPTRPPSGPGRGADLVALLILTILSAVVFILVGPTAFTAVTSAGLSLYATWRSH